jgi:hypothetical protein
MPRRMSRHNQNELVDRRGSYGWMFHGVAAQVELAFFEPLQGALARA